MNSAFMTRIAPSREELITAAIEYEPSKYIKPDLREMSIRNWSRLVFDGLAGYYDIPSFALIDGMAALRFDRLLQDQRNRKLFEAAFKENPSRLDLIREFVANWAPGSERVPWSHNFPSTLRTAKRELRQLRSPETGAELTKQNAQAREIHTIVLIESTRADASMFNWRPSNDFACVAVCPHGPRGPSELESLQQLIELFEFSDPSLYRVVGLYEPDPATIGNASAESRHTEISKMNLPWVGSEPFAVVRDERDLIHFPQGIMQPNSVDEIVELIGGGKPALNK